MKHRTLTSLFAAAALAVSLTASAPASAATIQLGFILDSSGSITAGGWSTIVNGLSTAILNNIPLPGADTYEVSVVSFASTAQTIVNHMLINSAGARTTAAGLVTAAPFIGTNTNYAIAFAAMQAALTGSPNFSAAGTSYVNFATDGAPNEPTDFATGLAAGIVARNNLINAGIDNISIEGIGINAAGQTLLENNFCFPQACDNSVPFNFPAQGFYISVASPQGYADAIGNKIRVVTRRSYGFRTLSTLRIALFHALGHLPEPEQTHRFA
jgi:hypothetical protein